jgi:amino acid transporter
MHSGSAHRAVDLSCRNRCDAAGSGTADHFAVGASARQICPSLRGPSSSFFGQVAVFAGETRDAAHSILRSAWIAAPAIALMYILMTGSVLTYTPADQVDLVNPVAQVIAAAFRGAGATGGIDWGEVLGRAAILSLTLALIAQSAVYIAEVHPSAPALSHADSLIGGYLAASGLVRISCNIGRG